MTENESRAALTAEALTWINTPYHPDGSIKGVGCNCAMFLFRVAKAVGVLATDAPEPDWYTPQHSLHSEQERLIEYLLAYGGFEIPKSDVKPGDVIVYKNGKSHGHAALVLKWPVIIHVMRGHGCQMGTVDEGFMGSYSRRYFTFFKPAEILEVAS